MDSNSSGAHHSDWWSIDLPQGWNVRLEPECTEFYAEKSVGVLQISAAKKPTGLVELNDLYEFASTAKKHPHPLQTISTSHASGIFLDYHHTGFYWKEWWLRSDATMIYATYNVSISARDTELPIIEKMIESLQIKH